jgi:hypothetical protein
MEPAGEDPWGGQVPWLRRRGPRVALALVAAGSFLALTLMSTCSTRTAPPATTTTTRPMIQAGEVIRGSAPDSY